jgi:hypothetical protein
LSFPHNLLFTNAHRDGIAKGENSQLMTYEAKVAVCSEIRTKHSTQSEHHVEMLSAKPGGT